MAPLRRVPTPRRFLRRDPHRTSVSDAPFRRRAPISSVCAGSQNRPPDAVDERLRRLPTPRRGRRAARRTPQFCGQVAAATRRDRRHVPARARALRLDDGRNRTAAPGSVPRVVEPSFAARSLGGRAEGRGMAFTRRCADLWRNGPRTATRPERETLRRGREAILGSATSRGRWDPSRVTSRGAPASKVPPRSRSYRPGARPI